MQGGGRPIAPAASDRLLMSSEPYEITLTMVIIAASMGALAVRRTKVTTNGIRSCKKWVLSLIYTRAGAL